MTDDGERQIKASTCIGDSGGPLVCAVNGKAHLIGVTSLGDCKTKLGLTYFARVTKVLSWIESNMG